MLGVITDLSAEKSTFRIFIEAVTLCIDYSKVFKVKRTLSDFYFLFCSLTGNLC
jgi:hypothetical protein